VKHNHRTVLIAILFQQALAYVWYSPGFFLQVWTAASGKELSPWEFMQNLPLLASLIGSAMFCYLMSWLYQVLVIDDWWRGLIVGLLIGAGFVLPPLAQQYLLMGYTSDLICVDGVRLVLSSGITGLLLATWRAEQSAETA
jgi:hypothetical protein